MATLKDEVRSNDARDASVARVDMKLEVVVIAVSDVDRAKEFYAKLGWRLDADFAHGDDWRVIQFTPPGSGYSVIFGKNVTAAAPGSAQGLYLIVSDIDAARDELLRRGVEISKVFRGAEDVYAGMDEPYLFGRVRVSGPDPSTAATARSPRSVIRRQRLAVPGAHDSAARSHGLPDDDLRVGERSGERTSACGGRPRRAREAHRGSATRTGPIGMPRT